MLFDSRELFYGCLKKCSQNKEAECCAKPWQRGLYLTVSAVLLLVSIFSPLLFIKGKAILITRVQMWFCFSV